MKPSTRIKRQLTMTPLECGHATLLRNGESVGQIEQVMSAFGPCYEITLFGKVVSAARDIPNAIDHAAFKIWQAEVAALGVAA